MSGAAELVSPGIRLVTPSSDPRGFRRVCRFVPTEHRVAELVNPHLKLKSAPQPRSGQYRRVCRFVSYGVDKVMEGHKKHVSMLTPGKSRYGRVSYFTASGMEKPAKDTIKPTKQGSFRHVDCFIASGIAKGEGHIGGGTVADICNIGLNPMRNFREVRVKRQSKDQVEANRQDFNNPLDRKTSAAEMKEMKLCQEEAAADIQASRKYNARQREEELEEREKKKVAIDVQPSVGVPKVSNSEKLLTQSGICGDEKISRPKADMWLLLTGREGLLEKYKDLRRGCRRRKEGEEEVSEQELKKQKERKDYYIKFLEQQKLKKQDSLEEKVVPTDFIWGRAGVERNMSGKLIPRTRPMYDTGSCNQSLGTYFSVGNKIAQLPEKRSRGTVNEDSYQTWGTPGSAAIMRNMSNRNTSTAIVPRSVQLQDDYGNAPPSDRNAPPGGGNVLPIPPSGGKAPLGNGNTPPSDGTVAPSDGTMPSGASRHTSDRNMPPSDGATPPSDRSATQPSTSHRNSTYPSSGATPPSDRSAATQPRSDRNTHPTNGASDRSATQPSTSHRNSTYPSSGATPPSDRSAATQPRSDRNTHPTNGASDRSATQPSTSHKNSIGATHPSNRSAATQPRSDRPSNGATPPSERSATRPRSDRNTHPSSGATPPSDSQPSSGWNTTPSYRSTVAPPTITTKETGVQCGP